jgi:mannose-6-phosphate isomerase-like protein (cupin superfamily)
MRLPVRLEEKFDLFQDRWSPKIIAAANGQLIKLAKLQGEFVWHAHADEDEVFLVHKGEIVIRLREDGAESQVRLSAGDLFVVPKGVEHKPEAAEEAEVLLFEPAATAHTGAVQADITVAVKDQKWL